MKTKEEIINLLSQQKPEFEAKFKVRSMALFGSYARGNPRHDSDVDIIVDVDPSIGLEFVTLAENIEKLIGQRIELVSLRALKPRQLEYIQPELIYV